MKHFLPIAILALACGASGCLAAVPTVPVTPANQTQISACQNDANFHNWSVIGGTGLAGVAGAEGAIETQVPNVNTQHALEWSILLEGVVAAAAATLAGVESANYVQSGCPALTGPLPIKPAPVAP
jgi:hypothetical protein